MHFRPPFRGCFRICGRDKSDPYGCERIANYVANIPQNANEQSVKCATNTPPGVGDRFIVPVSLHYQIRIFTLLNTCIHIIKYTFPHQRTRISTLSNTCFYIIEYVYSFHRIRAFALPHTHIHITEYVFSHHHTHISVCHFVGVFIYAGAINRTPTAANGLPKCC